MIYQIRYKNGGLREFTDLSEALHAFADKDAWKMSYGPPQSRIRMVKCDDNELAITQWDATASQYITIGP